MADSDQVSYTLSIYPQKLSNEINEKALVMYTNLKFLNLKQRVLQNNKIKQNQTKSQNLFFFMVLFKLHYY
jgi:hypothetical protein